MDIAQLTLSYESLGNTIPFQVLNGYEPRTSWDVYNPELPETAIKRLNRDDALKVASRIKRALEFV